MTPRRDAGDPAVGLYAAPLTLRLDAADVVRRLAHRERVTAWAGSWSRGALVTCDPVREMPADADPFDVLGSVPDRGPDPRFPDAVGGGWFGYLGFAAPGDRPRASLAWYRDVLRHDGERWWYEALLGPDGDEEAARARCSALSADLAVPAPAARAGITVERWPDRDAHLAAVEACIGEIRRGEIYQANVACEIGLSLHGGVHEAWARLVGARPGTGTPARAALVADRDLAAVSASPELFLRREGREVRTDPIKGTRPRDGATDLADAEQQRRLAGSAKDSAENVMIVDLMRNDLARVCAVGSVRVAGLLSVEPHPGVWHLVSRVRGRLPEGAGDGALLRATFPPGSVTGAPKVRAVQVIESLEAQRRGLFTGALGYASPLAGLELGVTIRTLEVDPPGPDGTASARLGVGGGITVDSDPAEEWAECLTKAAPVLGALGGGPVPAPADAVHPARRADGLFETLAAVDGRVARLGEHAARLRRSFLSCTGEALTADVEAAVTDATAGLHGPLRVRVQARPGRPGRVEVRAVAWTGPVPITAQPGLVMRVRHTPECEPHKFEDRRWLDAHEAAVSDGETPLLTGPDGAVLESTRSSVFLVIGAALRTPPLDGRILPGTARRAVLDLAGPDPSAIAPIRLGDVAGADGMFLTNALRGVQWVREVRDGDAVVARWSAPDPLILRTAAELARATT
ncbi:bifunctional chorismate-binding protein/class IV aminotransferase [Pseudonocardia sp. KRD291]|uniref:bifunctional chorismate-binding protein/class IV aminotransferase n=1 Tax=Pseudonocardia sp. KRD291 TaxID=2792007 RepID=UPI001C4A48CE|nr:bifunctional chorismate-binding protein/class IV aminotransferase [Pseudonocardia sp. KRD291]MBW0106533.1 chorismate-binding protein [Pseudonocardia sp. KRD291]